MQSFNSEDLIQFIYNETSQEKSAAIRVALDTDWILKETYDTIGATHQSLEPISLSPRNETINFIMAYAEKSISHLATEV